MAAKIAPLLQRQLNAADRFVEAVGEQFGLTEAEGRRALRALLDAKLVKLDPLVGQFSLRDGRVWCVEVMRRAASKGGE